jgi:TATA-binding protein-associated factor Taf7
MRMGMVLQFNVYDRSIKVPETGKTQTLEMEIEEEEEKSEELTNDEDDEEDEEDEYEDRCDIFEYSKAIPLGSYPEE